MAQLGPIQIPFHSFDDIETNSFFAPNLEIVSQLESYMDTLQREGDSCGARISVCASGVPVGWGEPLIKSGRKVYH
jgi:chorismate synthase